MNPHQRGKAMVLAASKEPHAKDTQSRGLRQFFPALGVFQVNVHRTTEQSSDTHMPQVSECAIHLELLEIFSALRQQILVSTSLDRAMDIRPKRVVKVGKKGDRKTLRDDTFWDRRQAKWTQFIEFAVARFLQWRATLDLFLGGCDAITVENLPPIDIIMVWHSFLLNPLRFKGYCQNEALYSIPLPWQSIHQCINNDDWSFSLCSAAKRQYQTVSGLKWDLLTELETWGPSTLADALQYPQLNTFGIGLSPSTENISSGDIATKYAELFKVVENNMDLAAMLRDAVLRQTAFVDKMNAHMWIRSPALEGTLRRAIDRYAKFCELLRNSKEMLVPTLDIDLVWHTHQCAAVYYGRGMEALVGRFVNHDDTVGKNELATGSGYTRRLFRTQYGKEYRTCGCWYCEALLSELESCIDAKTDERHVDMSSIVVGVKEQVARCVLAEVARREEKANIKKLG